MSGIILFSDDTDWFVSSGLFNWVMEYLVSAVDDPPTKAELTLIDEQNFKFLDCSRLAGAGRSQVLDALARTMLPYAEAHLPESEYRAGILELLRTLADTAAAHTG